MPQKAGAKPNNTKNAKNPKPKKTRQPKAPVSVGTVLKVNAPRVAHKNGCVSISHTELIGNVQGSVAFTVNKFDINAGLASMFVWLTNIAANYESYKFKKLKFRYTQSCATTQTGFVYLSVEFDPSDPIPDSEPQLATYDGCVYGSAWTQHVYDCSGRNLSKRSSYFVRVGALSNTADLPLYDTGYLVVATTGNTDTSVIGKLWVDYEVELSTPQLGSVGVGRALSAFFTGSTDFTVAPTKTGNAPLTASVAANILTLTCTQPYQALINFTLAGTTITAVATTGSTCTIAQASLTISAPQDAACYSAILNFTTTGQTLLLDITAATVTATRIRFGQYNVSNG